jgi:hypothetical protein
MHVGVSSFEHGLVEYSPVAMVDKHLAGPMSAGNVDDVLKRLSQSRVRVQLE